MASRANLNSLKFYKVLFVFSIFYLVLFGCQPSNVPSAGINQPVACTEEAKICDDGTVVSRTGPNCEFTPCPELPKPQVVATWQTIVAKDISGINPAYTFTAQIPVSWRVEAVPAIEAINIFNPNSKEENNLEKSQIFIRYFKANTFLTLSTVNIYSRTETEINGQPAVIYDIEKKPGIADFSSQPAWRSQRHLVTDIRVSDQSPSVFYVIGQRPDLDQEIFDQFLNSLNVDSRSSALTFPVKDFKERITKKPFGIYITPETSPVQPERFSGYHTGVDVEYTDVGEQVPVSAISSGKVIYSGRVNGYGGVVVINHLINGKNYLVLYGHLSPSSLIVKDTMVEAGDRIGILGKGQTSETDGERKHLHLSIYTGSDLNFRGYVQNQEELKKWLDPLTIF